MKNELLPMGSVIEFENKKYIIVGYNLLDYSYVCDGYPTDVMDLLVSSKHIKEYKAKYDNYNISCFIKFNADFTVIFTGYQNETFYSEREKLYSTGYLSK